ncbi:MAG: hypothetical protein ACREDW_10060, partial [Aestuariivirgaceae bacterium]
RWALRPVAYKPRPFERALGFPATHRQLIHNFFIDCPPNGCQQIIRFRFGRDFVCPAHCPNRLSSDPGADQGISIIMQQLVLSPTPLFVQSECDSQLNF